MIGKLTGLVDYVDADYLILDVGGVGYRVFCSGRTLSKLPARGQSMALFIETQVREDHIHLFGFADATEKQAFGIMTTVQGVGAKVALAILSALSANEIQMAIMTGDSKAFTRASGVGPKLAARIVAELKHKMGTLGTQEEMVVTGTEVSIGNSMVLNEAVSALVNLGYGKSEAGMAVATVLRANPNANVSDLIRLSLKEIGKGAF